MNVKAHHCGPARQGKLNRSSPFWVDRLGFTKTIEVPDGNRLAFVAFQKGATEVMYQTYESVGKKTRPKQVSETRAQGPPAISTWRSTISTPSSPAMKDAKIVMGPCARPFYGHEGIQRPRPRRTLRHLRRNPLPGRSTQGQ